MHHTCPNCLHNAMFCRWKMLGNIVLQPAILIPGMAISLCCHVEKIVRPTSSVESCRKLHAGMLSLKNYMNIDITGPKLSLLPWHKWHWVNLIYLSIYLLLLEAQTACTAILLKDSSCSGERASGSVFSSKHMACLTIKVRYN